MSKAKVPLWQRPQNFAVVDTEATKGATVGVNLYWPGGAVVTEADLAQAAAAPASPVSRTMWSLVLSIPPNVTALQNAAGTGLFAVTGPGTGALRTLGDSANIAWTNGDGVAGDPVPDLIDLTDAGGGTLQKTAFDAKGRKTGTSAATTSDLAEGTNLYHTDERAQAAVVVATITPGDTTHAPSGDAVNTALGGKAPLTRPQFTDWVGIGTPASRPLTINSDTSTLPGGEASMLVFGSANNERIEARSASGDPTFQGKASLGTIAAPLAIEAGKSLVTLAGSAHNGLFWITGNRALLRAQATETWSSTANGCEWRLATTPNGASALVWCWAATHDGHWAPTADNVSTLGIAGNRIKEIHCANSVINTSDAREKTPLRPLDDTELAIARDIAGIVGIYQWLAAVAEKGEDGARLHCGAIAQEVIAAFEAHGRDAFRYGIACYDEWPETLEPATDDSPEVIHPAGNRYSLRYGELSMFLIAGQEARLRALEAKA